MTPRGPVDHETGDLPDPPYSAEILAEARSTFSGPTELVSQGQVFDLT